MSSTGFWSDLAKLSRITAGSTSFYGFLTRRIKSSGDWQLFCERLFHAFTRRFPVQPVESVSECGKGVSPVVLGREVDDVARAFGLPSAEDKSIYRTIAATFSGSVNARSKFASVNSSRYCIVLLAVHLSTIVHRT